MNSSSLMDFSMLEDEENQFKAPQLTHTPVVRNSILKPSNKDNLIQLNTPVHKNLKVKFQTPQTKKVTPTRYDKIRELDDDEKWVERTTVVLKSDHEENMINAQAIIEDLITQSIDRSENGHREIQNKTDEDDTTFNLTLTQSNDIEENTCVSSENWQVSKSESKDVSSSPALPGKGGAYSIDFDNLDTIDPFKSAGSVGCSPSKNSICEANKDGCTDNLFDIKLQDIDITLSENLAEDADLTVVEKKQTDEAEVTVIENEALGKKSIDQDNENIHTFDLDLDNIKDPFTTKMQLANSPNITSSTLVGKDKSDFNATDLLADDLLQSIDEELCGDENLFSTDTTIENLPNPAQNENPLTPKTKIANSPAVNKEGNPFATKTKVANSPAISNKENPFATKTKMANSPAISNEENPFATKTKMANSPAISNEENPFVTKTRIANSPAISNEENPFTTKIKIANSPAISNEENPFATKTKIANSPAVSHEGNPFATKSKVPSSPVISNEDNPFATKSNMPNLLPPGLDLGEAPFVSKSKIPCSPTPLSTSNTDDSPATNLDDPFITKSKVPISPNVCHINPTEVLTSDLMGDIICSGEDNLFATSKKLGSSPQYAGKDKPFVTDTKIMNSPPISNQEDPFATSSKVPNSPVSEGLLEENPFASKSKVPNSPIAHLEQMSSSDSKTADPFVTKSKMANSPTANLERMQSSEPRTADPLVTKSKMSNSEKTQCSESKAKDPFVIKSNMTETPTILNAKATEISRKAEKPKEKCTPGFDTANLDIDEDQFKPASDIFNDTAAWDALENFGSNTDHSSALSRQSLYVKFDPLVNLPPEDPRRASMNFKRLSMKPGNIRMLTCDESFMLFGTPPKNLGGSQFGVVPTAGDAGKRKTPVSEKSAFDLLGDLPDSKYSEQVDDIMCMADIQDDDGGIVQVLKYTDADLKKIQHRILMESQGKLLAMERENTLLRQQFEKGIQQREDEIQKQKKSYNEIVVILAEYENTMVDMIKKMEEKEASLIKQLEEKEAALVKQKEKIDQLINDEQSMETAFSDMHRRYEKLKAALQGCKTNEETLKKFIDDFKENVKTKEEKLLQQKKEVETKLQKLMADHETLKADFETESSKNKITLKRKEMELQGLQNQLDQKIKENTELTTLCDELVAKVK